MDFSRINSSINTDMMQDSKVTVVGAPVGLTYDLARCGLGTIDLVDFDRISASNPARQDFNSTDIARHKVDAIAENLKKNKSRGRSGWLCLGFLFNISRRY